MNNNDQHQHDRSNTNVTVIGVPSSMLLLVVGIMLCILSFGSLIIMTSKESSRASVEAARDREMDWLRDRVSQLETRTDSRLSVVEAYFNTRQEETP